MKEDMMGNFVENVNRKLIKRNLNLTYILLNLVIVYILVSILDWYLVLKNENFTQLDAKIIYYYFVNPLVAVALMSLTIIAFSFLKKAHMLIDRAIEQDNADHFNAGYVFFSKTNMLTIFCYSIGIINIMAGILFRYWI